jgi:F1F0 ATPase subunit 2
MSEAIQLALSALAGLLLGALFFGGLYWTVLKGVNASMPALWFIGSLLLRVGITLAGFYFVADGDWRRLVAALTGFIIARLISTRLTSTAIINDAKQGENSCT